AGPSPSAWDRSPGRPPAEAAPGGDNRAMSAGRRDCPVPIRASAGLEGDPMTTRPEGTGPRQTRRMGLRAGATPADAPPPRGVPRGTRGAGADQAESAATAKGRLQQSVCRWCYAKIPLDDLCAAARRMGLVGIDLLKPEDFPTLKRFGLACTMTSSHPLANG